MKTELATTQNQVSVLSDKDLIGYLDNLGLTAKLNEGEKNTYINIAKAFGLNPFKREIHVSKYGDQMSIITGYEVYLKRAERTGNLNGWKVEISGSVDPNNPAKGDLTAKITIYRKDQEIPFEWEVYYDECVQTTKEGRVTKFWQKAKFMLKKVAISQGMRLCFSDELGGMPYTSDEMPDPRQEQTEGVVHVEVIDIEKSLRNCVSLEQLAEIYGKLNKADKATYKELKDALKLELTPFTASEVENG